LPRDQPLSLGYLSIHHVKRKINKFIPISETPIL